MQDKKQRIIRNMSTPESEAFWKGCKESAAKVSTWPVWKKTGIVDIGQSGVMENNEQG